VFIVAVAVSSAHVNSALAASPEVCDGYAKEAIAQLHEARSLGIPTPFPVWSDDYQHHYTWCLQQTDAALVQGRALRQGQIDSAAADARNPAPTPVVIDSTLIAAPPGGPQPGPATLPLPLPHPAQAGPTQNSLISQIQLATGKASRLQAASTSALVYSDRDFSYTQLPREVAAGLAIATSNDDKFAPAEAPYLRFRLDRPAMVYVAYAQRYRQRLAWLNGFQQTTAAVSYRAGNAELRLQLFGRAYPAGEVVLGGNLASGEQGNFGMYTVFVVPSATSAPAQVAGAAPSGAGKPTPTRPGSLGVAAATQQQTFELRPPRANAGQVSTPLLMYYVERRVVGVPTQTEADAYVARQFQASPETQSLLTQLLEKYKALPAPTKQLLFDTEALRLTSSPYNTVTASDIARVSSQTAMAPSLSGIQDLENPEPPEPPSRLVSVNSSGSSMEQQGSGTATSLGIYLQWRWDRPDRPEGFAIYRRLPSQTEFQLLTEVPASAVEYRDSPLPQPSAGQEAYCYEVRAFARPLVAVTWQPNRIESRPSNTSCTTYGPNAQPLADTDSDGMADPFDWCPNDGKPPTMPRVQGCPDGDVDGLIDSSPGGSVPAGMIDHCPPGEPGLDGYGPRGPQWDHLRAIDPLPGCPVRYQLRWMGLEVLNDPVDCTDPNAPYRLGCDGEVGLGNEYGQTNEAITPGQPLPAGFEPYLVFGMLNGVSDQGMAQQWTKRWCCGEGVQVGVVAVPDFPPSTINSSGIEPDTDFRGAESYEVDQTVLERGMLLFPEKFDVLYSSIDEQFGLILTTTLFERDFDMQYTPDKNETDISGFLEKGVGVMSNIVSCASTGGLKCAKALGEKVASLLTLGLTSNESADPVTVRDRDDVFGVASVSFTSREAADATSATGVYPFSQEIPGDGSYYVSFSKSIVPPPPLDSRARTVATMIGRSRFCLVRKGLEEAEILQLCRQ